MTEKPETDVSEENEKQAATTEELIDGGNELEAAREEAETQRNLYLRTAAELENVRRRAQRDVENAHRYGIERFARELLAVKDSLEMGLQAAQDAGEAGAVVDGFQATLKQLSQCLEKFAIEEIDALGQAFDPELHEAMAMQPADDQEPDTVIIVVQKGYKLHDRLLRPSRVIVAQTPQG